MTRLRYALGYVLATFGLLAGCAPPGVGVAPTFVLPPTAGPPPGSTYTVAYGSVAERIETRGRIIAQQEASLSFPMGGTLKAVYVAPGDAVERGALLAELDAPEAQRNAVLAQFDLELAEMELEIAQLQLAQAEAEPPPVAALAARLALERAQAELDRAQADYDQSLQRPWEPPEVAASYAQALRLSQLNYQLAQANLRQAIQSQQALSTTLAIQRIQTEMIGVRVARARWLRLQAAEQITHTRLLAPLSGIVVSVEKRAGDQVGAYETIGVVADPTRLWIVASVLEEDIDRISVGQKATIRLDVYPDEVYTGSVRQIVNEATLWQGRNAYEVTIAFDESQEAPAIIRMGADVIITGRLKENVLLIPAQAVITIGGRAYVEVASDDAQSERVEIRPGVTDGEWVEVLSGLQAGQVIRIP